MNWRIFTVPVCITILFCAVMVDQSRRQLQQTNPFQVYANMNSDSYIIQWNNINMSSGTQTKEGSYTVTQTSGQIAPGEYFKTNGYYVKAGFQYIYTIGTFGFSISNAAIDLGELTPLSFATGSATLVVSTKGAGGYTVTTAETRQLTHNNDTTAIGDTTCDDGACTETTATQWTNPSKSGFGYTMSGHDIPTAFVNTNYFKQFANLSATETPQTIMSSTGVGTRRTAVITVRATIPGSQAAGSYSNQLIFIATPTY